MPDYPAYRVVLSEPDDATTVTAATHGVDAVLNAAGGRILQAPESGDEEFLQICRDNGWLTSEGKLNGTFRRAAWSPVLNRIQVELSLRCNLSCSYCYSESGPLRRDVLTAERICDLVRQADEAGVTWIDLTGGEFFLFRGWLEVLQECRGRGLVTTVHTNGILLTDRNVEHLRAAGVRTVQVSADSADAAEHDSIRGLKGAHAKLIAGIQRAKQAGLAIRVLLIAHRRNAATFIDTVKWFRKELEVPVAVDRVIAAGGAIHDPVALSTKEFYELMMAGLPRSVATQKICESPRVGSPAEVAPECGVAHSFVYVTADGRVSLCPTMTHRDEAQFAGPSVFDTGLLEAWRDSDLFQRFRYLNCENATSRRCPVATECGGGCRSNAYLDSGSLTAPDYFACNARKNPEPVFFDFASLYRRTRETTS